jgi:hypothetical protein
MAKCYYCNKPGHLKCNCCKRKANEAGTIKANTTRDNGEEAEMVLSATEQALIVHSKEECWYLNSGATAHIPCKKGWLHNYISIKSEECNLILSDYFKC